MVHLHDIRDVDDVADFQAQFAESDEIGLTDI